MTPTLHRRRGMRPVLVLLVTMLTVLATGALSGCVAVPTTGKVERVDQGGPVNSSKPESVPRPPVKNASPRLIVDGFLFAMSRYQANYQTARQFLTDDARQSWRPEDKITVYGSPKYNVTDNNVTLSMSRIGQVGPDGSYSATVGTQLQDFRLQKNKNGQWRISNPPDGLLISDYSFSGTYASYNLYFFDPQYRTLVPDPIYLPTEGQTATALVQALLKGPTEWLAPAVTTAFPARTSLVGNAVTVSKGIAQIPLSSSVQTLNDQQKTQLAAQLAWTLSQLDDAGIQGFRITVDGTTLRIPRDSGDDQQAYVPVSYGQDYAPVPETDDTLIGVHDNEVMTVRSDGAQIAPVPGALGRGGYRIDSLALSTDGRMIAAVTDDRTRLITQLMAEDQPQQQLSGAEDLLRPEFTRYGELWAVGGKPGKQQIVMIKDGKQSPVRAPWLGRIQVTSFQISPDGSRMALVGKSGDNEILAVAPIVRGDRISLGNIRSVSLLQGSGSQSQRINDIGWISPTRLLILAASGAGGSYEPYGVEIDGSQFERVGTSDNWGATTLATQVNSGGTFSAVVGGRKNKAWAYQNGDEWTPLADDLGHPAYAG